MIVREKKKMENLGHGRREGVFSERKEKGGGGLIGLHDAKIRNEPERGLDRATCVGRKEDRLMRATESGVGGPCLRGGGRCEY